MLVLTRREGEWIAVGDQVLVKVLGVKGDSVQIGIEAPREIPVHRGEIYEQIRAATEAARLSASPDALARLMPKKTQSPGS
ncbi:MAG: carbon storage regulator CsrA [Gemmatimonadetes bacterium]|nr:carbon storage regulator CsrA [Gemmatimonadota bacterium]